MSAPENHKGLQLNEDLPFLQREWSIQRVGWLGLGLFLAAGVAGLLGPGPLSKSTTGNEGDAVRVTYFRFDRYHRQGQLRVHIEPSAVKGERARLWINREYMGAHQIKSISPEPVEQEAVGDRIVYEFAVDRLSAPLVVTFNTEFEEMGGLVAKAGLVDGAEVEFKQFVFP